MSTWPTISPAVRLRTSRCVPVWQKLQVSVQPTWLEMHKRAAVFLGDVDGLDFVPLAARVGRQPQQPFAGAVGGDLLGDDLGPRRCEKCRVKLLAQLLGDVASCRGRT